MARRLILTVLVEMLALAWVSFAPVAAATPQCHLQPNSAHCFSNLYGGTTTTPLYTGMYGAWNRAAMSAGCTSSYQSFVDSEMWFSPFQGGWVETGDAAGWVDGGASCDYYAFAAWEKQNGTGYTETALARLDHNDSTTDEFQISRAGSTNYFRAYFDGASIATSNVQFWSSRSFILGGEVATVDGTANTFNMNARALDAAGTRYLLPAQHTHVDSPPLNGVTYGNSEWSWNVQ